MTPEEAIALLTKDGVLLPDEGSVEHVYQVLCDTFQAGMVKGIEHQKNALDLQVSELKAKDKAFEDATVKNLEALTELLEVLTPFYFHARALKNGLTPPKPLTEISRVGVSHLVFGAFESLVEVYEKYGDIVGLIREKRIGHNSEGS